MLRVDLAEVSLVEGDLGSAEEIAGDALRQADAIDGRRDVRLRADLILAQAALRRANVVVARRFAEDAVMLIPEVDRPQWPAAQRILGIVQAAQGDPLALDTLTVACELAQEMRMRLEEARSLTALASLQEDSRSRTFHRARELFAACGSQRGLAEVNRAVAAARV
jgi:hypothetical protein